MAKKTKRSNMQRKVAPPRRAIAPSEVRRLVRTLQKLAGFTAIIIAGIEDQDVRAMFEAQYIEILKGANHAAPTSPKTD